MSKVDLKNLVDQLCEAIPSNLMAFKKDFEKSCHRILISTFSKLELVTREEFDTQSKVLLRTRKKLEELEKKLKELENKLKAKHRKHE
ncbi:MAG: hypothetical protein A3F13_07365 [Gammaproteobacteria bacterium RIFCSPHIGHO2_12_FULL_40_19]|nr:MAG: hypothetical protein A3F13_07365 [Gammaproteobacteria bacterium RIFCSPHIGHO2_12_FULL_40_19]